MTNEKALILNNVCTTLESEYFKPDSKFVIPKTLIYAVTKNISKTKGIVSEKKELDETILKVFKKDIDFDEKKIGEDKSYEEKVNAVYREYLKSDTVKEQLELFFNTEAKVDVHKVKVEVLDEAILPSAYKDILEETIVE
jgi:hypothetical protein